MPGGRKCCETQRTSQSHCNYTTGGLSRWGSWWLVRAEGKKKKKKSMPGFLLFLKSKHKRLAYLPEEESAALGRDDGRRDKTDTSRE